MLDVSKLKQIAIATWRKGRDDTLVKVMPVELKPSASMKIGWCGTLKFIVGRTPEEMGRTLGIATKLLGGVSVYLVMPLPQEHEFVLGGYSQLPGGIPADEQERNPEYPPGLGAPQWYVTAFQNRLVHLATVPKSTRFAYPITSIPAPI
jgi:hypothetical protein